MSLQEVVKELKLDLLKMHYQAGVGHIGSNLSCIDILGVLFHRILKSEDSFILSKGHSVGALYVVLASLGKISFDCLKTFHQDNTLLAGHPPIKGIAEIPFATGSLGHGLPLSAGTALAKKLRDSDSFVYCLMSDGEWNEGSDWESLMFSKQQRLNNLVIIVDNNGLQGLGKTEEIINIKPLSSKFENFGCSVKHINGHNLDELEQALRADRGGTAPQVVVADTVKGKGISFMENNFEWHYWAMNEGQYQQATKEISGL